MIMRSPQLSTLAVNVSTHGPPLKLILQNLPKDYKSNIESIRIHIWSSDHGHRKFPTIEEMRKCSRLETLEILDILDDHVVEDFWQVLESLQLRLKRDHNSIFELHSLELTRWSRDET